MNKLSAEILEGIVETVAEEKTETSGEPAATQVKETTPTEKKETPAEDSEEGSGGEAKTSTETSKGEATPPPAVEIKAEEKKAPPPASFKVKVDGEEIEVDQNEVVRGYQLASTSHKRFQAAAQYKKDADRIMEALDKDPIATTFHRLESKYNGDSERAEKELYNLCLKYVEPFVLAKQMPEEERETFEDRRRLEREKSKIEVERARLKSEKEAQAIKIAEEKFDRELRTAISKHKISTEPKILKRLASFIREEYLDPGIDFEAEDAVYAFSDKLRKAEEEWKAISKPTTPAAQVTTSTTAKTSTPAPFSPTPSKGEESQTRERAPRQRTFTNKRDFHEALLQELR